MNGIAGVGAPELCQSWVKDLIAEFNDIARWVKNYILRHRFVLTRGQIVKAAQRLIQDSVRRDLCLFIASVAAAAVQVRFHEPVKAPLA